MVLEGALVGSDALAPAFVHNVLDPLEIGGAQRCDVAVRAIDNFGEMRQFDLLGLGNQISIKVLKQRIARTRLFCKCKRQDAYAPITADGSLDFRSVYLF